MSQQLAPPHFSIGSKVFLLGEYAVLLGLPALVGILPQRFQMSIQTSSESFDHPLVAHPDSPLGRLQTWVRLQPNHSGPNTNLQFVWVDPFLGQGGFGASTAQFAMGYYAYSLKHAYRIDWKSVWTLYRELMSRDTEQPPSGADLVAQWTGGVVCFSFGSEPQVFSKSLDWSRLLVFSATGQSGRKVATHEHLNATRSSSLEHLKVALGSVLERGLSAVQSNNPTELGQAFDAYAEVLRQAHLECDATFEDRQVLRKLPGVLGVKGTGALQSDGIIVLTDESSRLDEIKRVAESRGLTFLSQGFPDHQGVLCH